MEDFQQSAADLSSRSFPCSSSGKEDMVQKLSERTILRFVDSFLSLLWSDPLQKSEQLLVVNAQLEVQIQALNWYSRAPSTSNPGDAPCRLEFAEVDLKGHARC